MDIEKEGEEMMNKEESRKKEEERYQEKYIKFFKPESHYSPNKAPLAFVGAFLCERCKCNKILINDE